MTSLAQVMCKQGLTSGFAEVRRLIYGKAITVNGKLATSWDMQVKRGDVVTCGKHKQMEVRDD